jgi:hypothetical protein
LKSPTISGMAVIFTLMAMTKPSPPPMMMPAAIHIHPAAPMPCPSTVATAASSIPIAPSMLPRTAVRGEVRPLMPKMKSPEATR